MHLPNNKPIKITTGSLSARAKGQVAANTHKVHIRLSVPDMAAVRTGKASIFRPMRDNWPIGTLLIAKDSKGELVMEIKNKKLKVPIWKYDVEADS